MTTASLAQQLTESYVAPDQELTAVAEARPQTTLAAPYPQFDAGDRLTNPSELLEMITIKLSSETKLFTQRTSRQFPRRYREFISTSTSAILHDIFDHLNRREHYP